MNPELPQVHNGSEAVPQIPGAAEYFPDGTRSPEVMSPSYEQQQTPSAELVAAPPQAMPVVPVPAPQSVVPAPVRPDPVLSGAPAVAGDDDLIEKEWVDKLKSIIALTKGKPYEQAKAIALLQADYLKKRHNRVLGGTDG